MSFIHYTLVGHFNPRATNFRVCARPIDLNRVQRLLGEYPQEVADLVTLQDGYARCQWVPAPRDITDLVIEFAYRLAREEGCVAAENGREVTYPPEAAREQGEVFEQVFGRPGAADDAEQRARRQFEERERRRIRRLIAAVGGERPQST